MTGHKRAHRSRSIMFSGAPLEQRLATELPRIIDTVLARLVEELPAYGRLPHEQLVGDTTRIIERCVRTFIEVVRTGDAPPHSAMDELRDVISQRAEEGLPLDAMLAAHHLGMRAAWDLVTKLAGPDDIESAMRATELQLRYLQDVTAAIANGYYRDRQALLDDDHVTRQALLAALLEGKPTAETATRAGIVLPARYFVLELAIAEHGDEQLPDVNPTVVARRKLRRLRAELERRIGDPVLSMLHPSGGVVLVPSNGVETGDADWAELRRLIAAASRAAGASITAGANVAETSGVAAASRISRQILAVAAASGRPPGIYRLRDVALEFQLSQPGQARDTLAALLDPIRDRPELLTTLRAYFQNELSRRHTAQQLHVHPNTVDYRLRKIAGLTGLDTTMAADLPRIRAALTAMQASDAESGSLG